MGYPLTIENGKAVISPCDNEMYSRILSNLAYINYKLKKYDIAKSLFKRQVIFSILYSSILILGDRRP